MNGVLYVNVQCFLQLPVRQMYPPCVLALGGGGSIEVEGVIGACGGELFEFADVDDCEEQAEDDEGPEVSERIINWDGMEIAAASLFLVIPCRRLKRTVYGEKIVKNLERQAAGAQL